MRIHADKTETPPPHALRVHDLRRILASVPPDWIERLSEVHLSNSLELHSPWAYFSSYNGRLTVYSRRGTSKQALQAVLAELAACALGINTRSRHRRSKADAHRLDQLIQPIVDQLLPEIAPLRRPEAYHSWAGFRPLSLTKEDAEQSRSTEPGDDVAPPK